MALGKESVKIQVIISKEDRQKIEKLAKKENRSVSNWVYDKMKKYL